MSAAVHRGGGAVGNQNFVPWYDRHARPTRLDLLGVPQRPAPRSATPTLTPALTQRPLVSISDRLATALRTPRRITVTQLLLALRWPEAELREEVQHTFLHTLEHDRTLATTLKRTDLRQLAALIRSLVADRSDEVVAFIHSRTRDPELRSRAAQLLRALRGSNPTEAQH